MSTTSDHAALPDALASLPAEVQAGLEIVASRRLGNAEDVREAVQETLTRTLAAARAGRIPSDVTLGAYAGGILRHVIADKLSELKRHRGNGAPLDPDKLPSRQEDPLHRLVARESVLRLRRALKEISSAERALLRRIFVVGEKVSDIARRTGEPAERLRQRKLRALRRLRALMEDGARVTDGAPPRQQGHDHE
jgi:RNA polymerase sigma factor (sigma-70 family)